MSNLTTTKGIAVLLFKLKPEVLKHFFDFEGQHQCEFIGKGNFEVWIDLHMAKSGGLVFAYQMASRELESILLLVLVHQLSMVSPVSLDIIPS